MPITSAAYRILNCSKASIFTSKDNQPVMLRLKVHLKVVGLSYERSEIKTVVEMLPTNMLMPLLGLVHLRMRIARCHSKKSVYDNASNLRSENFPFIK